MFRVMCPFLWRGFWFFGFGVFRVMCPVLVGFLFGSFCLG